MECPVCAGRTTKVVDSRDSRDGVRRRRVCNTCGHRFTTRERIDETLPSVIKRTGERQPFDRAKIRRGLEIACRKRGVPSEALDRIVTRIETWASTKGDREVDSEELGEQIMHHLYILDQVAYVRFVSVYRSFETIAEFEHLLREMQKAERVNIEGQRTLFPEVEPPIGPILPGAPRAREGEVSARLVKGGRKRKGASRSNSRETPAAPGPAASSEQAGEVLSEVELEEHASTGE